MTNSGLKRVSLHIVFVLAMLYVAAQLAPQPAFAYSLREERFTLYSDRPIDATERAALLEAARRIAGCGLDDPAMRHDVFLCHDAARFVFFAPLDRDALGITNVFGVSIVKAHTERSLASLIAHERTHAMLVRRYGVVGNALLPKWKCEGVCEYVAGDISYDIEAGKALLRAGRRENSAVFRYFTYWLAAKHLVETDGLTLSQVIASPRSEAEALRDAVEALGDE